MAIRKTLIVSKTAKLEDVKVLAAACGIGEITFGIPPRLEGQIEEKDLPYVHTEDNPAPEVGKEFNLADEISRLDLRIKALEIK